MSNILQDLRFALRTLGKRPGFTLLVVGIMAIGMGATISVVDLTNLLAWRQLPAERPDELVKVFTSTQRGFAGPHHPTSHPDYVDYRDANQSFSGLAAHVGMELRLDTGDGTEYAHASAVSGNFFEVLKPGKALGRVLSTEDDLPGAAPALMIAHHLWQRLGADPRILGKTMSIEGRKFTLVGVGPAGFTTTTAGEVTDFFVPLAALPQILGPGEAEYLDDRARGRMNIIGRLQPGISRAAAAAELNVLAGRIEEDHPRVGNAPRQISVTAANIVHPVDLRRMEPSLRLFAVAVVLLLVITCANVAHLLLARSLSRRREMGIRQSMGASRARLVRQLMTENFLLAMAGGMGGLLIAHWARAFMRAFAGPEFVAEMRFDPRVIAASFGICLAATLLFGLAPALVASRVNLVSSLKGGLDTGRQRRFSAGQLLSAAQVALCVVLLVAGALLTQSLRHRLNADRGFDDDSLLIARIALPEEDYSQDEGKVFFRQLRERAEALPGVEQAGIALLVPPILFDISLPFQLPEDPDTERRSRINVVDEGYFKTLGIPLEQGRLFDAQDAVSEKAVVVINRHLAEQLWPGEDPLGRTLRVNSSRPTDLGPDLTVIGVVSSISQHRSSHGGEPVFYLSSAQRYRSSRQLVLRSTTDAPAQSAAIFESLRQLLREMDPSLAATSMRTGPANRREAFTFEFMQARAVGTFAAFGLALAVLGVFGVLSHAVSRQVREVGIRMALGARRQDVLRQVVGQGMIMTSVGISTGLVATFFLSHLLKSWLESLLFGVTPGDVRVLVAVAFTVLLAALSAAYLPARRASRLDPLKALRHE